MTTDIFFISGHLDLTEQQFDKHYVPLLEESLKNPLNRYVVGDARGADFMSQQWLRSKGVPAERVTVHHMFNKPRFIVAEYERTARSGYSCEEARDEMMTLVSTKDILWLNPNRTRISGTQKNLERRQTLTDRTSPIKSSPSPEREELESMDLRPTSYGSEQYRVLYFIAETLVAVLEELRSKR